MSGRKRSAAIQDSVKVTRRNDQNIQRASRPKVMEASPGTCFQSLVPLAARQKIGTQSPYERMPVSKVEPDLLSYIPTLFLRNSVASSAKALRNDMRCCSAVRLQSLNDFTLLSKARGLRDASPEQSASGRQSRQ